MPCKQMFEKMFDKWTGYDLGGKTLKRKAHGLWWADSLEFVKVWGVYFHLVLLFEFSFLYCHWDIKHFLPSNSFNYPSVFLNTFCLSNQSVGTQSESSLLLLFSPKEPSPTQDYNEIRTSSKKLPTQTSWLSIIFSHIFHCYSTFLSYKCLLQEKTLWTGL